MIYTKQFKEKIWETVTEGQSTAWQQSSTYIKFDEGNTGNNGLGNHELTMLKHWLS
jgi:hypothetical protein